MELNGNTNTKNSSQLSLVSNSTIINNGTSASKQHLNNIYSNGQLNNHTNDSADNTNTLQKSHQRALFNEYYSNSNTAGHLQNCQDQISKLQKHQQNLAQLPPMIPNHQYRYNLNEPLSTQTQQQQLFETQSQSTIFR